MRGDATFAAGREFDREVQNLVDAGYPALAGVGEEELRALLEPLRECAVERARGLEPPTRARVPFVLVVSRTLVPLSRSVPLLRPNGKPGFVSGDTLDIDRFEPIPPVEIPAGAAYVAFDVDRGEDFLGVRPRDALSALLAAGRSPLTAEEGVALVAHHPGCLEKNRCFQLLASRCGDKRVPGLWISGGRPKLGFCWEGNFHTWLGAASCSARAGA